MPSKRLGDKPLYEIRALGNVLVHTAYIAFDKLDIDAYNGLSAGLKTTLRRAFGIRDDMDEQMDNVRSQVVEWFGRRGGGGGARAEGLPGV